MKTIKLLSLLSFIILFNSCVTDDHSDDFPSYLGTWNLTKSSGTIAGTTTEFESGLIKWEITSDSIYVINNNTDENLQDGFQTGPYSYTLHEDLSATDCVRWLSFGPDDRYCLGYSYNELSLNQFVADGINYDFIR